SNQTRCWNPGLCGHTARVCGARVWSPSLPRREGAAQGLDVDVSTASDLGGAGSLSRPPQQQTLPSPFPLRGRWSCGESANPWVYDDKDYRRIRFVGRQKEVNENFAIDLIAEQPVSGADSRVVACDGGGGALGHPKVYINLDKETNTGTCGYCGLQFRQQRQH
ncbi:NADH dehydrogenase [ubiquinone] iron-sulfur protein 6, mitochondrial, partial [Suricata suricatta]|uniref:NADH dehydrogenase [ubiquinone] iron-sulfur protein 6, mitochondrial n=1 Tax=Suricata suricatta TaxID=37032 RepID=UPI0011559F6A